MTIVAGQGNTWNLLNYAGELFTADPVQTPLMSMVGGLTGGMRTQNFEFPTAQLFAYPTATQPSISEQASATAPAAEHIARTQETNVVQIHQRTLDLTYFKLSNSGRMSGLNTASQAPSPAEELAWQITHTLLVTTARDVEYSFIRGTYQKSTGATIANKTRGMLELCSSGTTIAAGNTALTKDMLQTLYRTMADNGAYFDNMVMFVPAALKQRITDLYSSQFGFNLPATRNIGGVNVTTIETDFFNLGVIWNRFMPTGNILLADVAHVTPVFMEVPNKGVLFVEDLANIGASERRMLYGQIGLAHGPAFLHGSITGLTL